jgi:hypothetical protein
MRGIADNGMRGEVVDVVGSPAPPEMQDFRYPSGNWFLAMRHGLDITSPSLSLAPFRQSHVTSRLASGALPRADN